MPSWNFFFNFWKYIDYIVKSALSGKSAANYAGLKISLKLHLKKRKKMNSELKKKTDLRKGRRGIQKYRES